ncbi:hypothetical protein KEM55_003488 [Ascosphaera atra]|nr:hypothetical protein KEM55_003488 [Ascosphaera atra]
MTSVELFDSAPRLEDLVSNVSSFESLMPQLEEASQPDGRGFSIKCQLLPDASHSDRTVKTSQSIDGKILHDMYDLLLRHSISPLPSGIPGSVRLAKEELIREILMELVLARVSLAKQRELKPAVEVKETEPQTSQNKSRLQSPLKAPVPQSQQSAPASSNVLSSQPSQTPTRAQQQDDSYSVLKLYTTVQGAEAPSKQARSILSHWSLEDDPAEYDWQAATRAAREEAQSHLETDQVRERRKKREKRKQKQKQDEDLASRRTTPAVPSVRPVVSASQPTQRSQRTQRTSMSRTPAPSASFTSHADSQLTDLPTYSFMSNSSQPQIMSQSERGVFGGREARRVKAPDRRKSRAAGF